MADNRFKNDEFEDIFSNSSNADEYEDIYSGDISGEGKTDSNDIVILKQLLLLKLS